MQTVVPGAAGEMGEAQFDWLKRLLNDYVRGKGIPEQMADTVLKVAGADLWAENLLASIFVVEKKNRAGWDRPRGKRFAGEPQGLGAESRGRVQAWGLRRDLDGRAAATCDEGRDLR